ncbi:hypothetical protein EQV77_06295 [Halobacillus fulvus]|nr:hypothetical protein EQV77_06295 [Halobacillus fulvus]
MKKRTIFLIIGLMLVLLSAPALFVMGREVFYERSVQSKYKIETIYHPTDRTTDPFYTLQYLQDGRPKPFSEMKRVVYVNGEEVSSYNEFMDEVDVSEDIVLSRVISFYDTEITIADTFEGTYEEEAREFSDVRISIQGKNYADPARLEIRPTYLDNNRYHGYFGMVKMTERSTGEEQLIIIQRLFEDFRSLPEQDWEWKTISISEDGEVKTDQFKRDEIADPAYRRDLISHTTASPYALGYKSNVFHYYPSIFFPFLYPFVTAVLGIIFVVIGSFRR